VYTILCFTVLYLELQSKRNAVWSRLVQRLKRLKFDRTHTSVSTLLSLQFSSHCKIKEHAIIFALRPAIFRHLTPLLHTWQSLLKKLCFIPQLCLLTCNYSSPVSLPVITLVLLGGYVCSQMTLRTPNTAPTRSPFVTLLSRRAQSGRWSSFGKRVWFTESHIVLISSFFTCFIYSIYCW